MTNSRWTVEGDERDEKNGVHSTYNYHINLAAKTPAPDGDKKSKCKNAAVCQTKKEDAAFFRGIGNTDSKKYFIEGKCVVENNSWKVVLIAIGEEAGY